MGVLSDLMGGGESAGAVSKVGAMLERKKSKKKRVGTGAVSGSNYDGDTGSEVTGESFKRGGKVKRTGLAKVHAGEQVLTSKQAKRYKARGKKR